MTETIHVKFLSKALPGEINKIWLPLIPPEGFEGVTFTFDPADQDYDFLVIYEGLPLWPNRDKSARIEPLSCNQQNTLLVTTEPSSIRIDGPHFMRQFGHVLTSKSPKLTRHSNHIIETPPLRWFYGRPLDGSNNYATLSQLRSNNPIKSDSISTVCSTKRMSHTVHAARLNFVAALQKHLPELDVYGRGLRPISDKSEAMDAYRYHIAIENHVESGHWTEKLSDCFLAGCLPFYFGDPDYAKAFPENAVIPINIFDLHEAVSIIRKAIAENAYESRLSAINEARRRVLGDYNLLGWIAKFVRQNLHVNQPSTDAQIMSRYAFRRYHPIKGVSDIIFRVIMRHHPVAKPLQL